MNGASSSEFYLDAVTNNSFTLSNVEDTIKQTIKNSFGYLDQLQKNAIDLYRAHFTSEDLHTFDERKQRVRLVVPKDLINATVRDKYKFSKFYQKEITLKDISDNQDVFIHVPLVFLNGMNTVKFTMKAYESNTEIYFDKTDELMSCNDITVLYLLNDGVINAVSNKYVFKDRDNKLPMKLFDSDVEFNTTGLTTITDIASMTGSSFNYATFEDNSVAIDLSANASSIISNSKRVSVSVIITRYMHTLESIITTYKDSDENVKIRPFIIVDDDGSAFKMPIPIDNVIVSKYDKEVGDFRIDNSISVSRTYPFIYDINDPNVSDGDMYQVIYFYYPMDVSYKYTNYLKYSYLLALDVTGCANIIDLVMALRNGEYPKFSYLLSFTPPDFEYSFADFDADPKYPYHFDYKIEKLKELIKDNPQVLANYVTNQSVANMFFEIYASKIDLSQRLRTDTYSEAKLEENQYELDEPCYLFSIFMGNDLIYDKVFYVDGIFCNHLYSFKEFGIEYVYIPASRVKDDSIIEVERLDGYEYDETITLTSTSDSSHISIKVPPRVHAKALSKDVFFLDESGKLMNKQKIHTNVTDGEISYDASDYEGVPVSEFDVSLVDDTYANLQMKVVVDKNNSVYPVSIEMNNIFVTYVPEIFYIKRDYIRAYVDGRIVRSEAIDVIYDEYSGQYILYVLKPARTNSIFTIQVAPVEYRRVYHQSEIPEDGVIDFGGKLNKPFSPFYFDVFVNGRKLIDENIAQISPMKVKFYGLKSLKNLEIYEKDRDVTEYFGDAVDILNSYDTMKTLEERLLDGDELSPEEKEKLVDIILYDKYKKKEFPHNIDNEKDELAGYVDVESLPIAKFTLNNIFESTRINPDEYQLDQSVLDHNVGTEIAAWLDSDSQASSDEKNVIRLNPDICAKTATAAQTISSQIGFTRKRIVDF